MNLNHLHLLVTDLSYSTQFYSDLFGFDRVVDYGPSLRFLQNQEGFDLALTPVESVCTLPEGIHFGFTVKNKLELNRISDHIKSLYPDLFVEAVRDHGTWGSFACLDPDGYVLEIYWDDTLHP